MVLYAAIGGLLAMMGGFAYVASLDVPFLEEAEIELQNVEVIEVNTVDDIAKLEITFLVKNPSDKTFTVPVISYTLYANGEELGKSAYSTEDIPMSGRAAFYPGTEIPLKSFFNLVKATVDSDIYDTIVSGGSPNYKAEGVLTVETAMSIVEKEF